MPLKNINSYLIHAINSLSAQTYNKFILIIICPTEEFESVANYFKNINTKLDYKILHTQLKGIAFAANLGIACATTKYIARCL